MFLASFSMIIIFLASNVVHFNRQKKNEKKFSSEPQKSSTKYTGKAQIGGNWLLYDTNGNPVTHKDFEGKYYLIYFGFTFCPDICPVSLNKMARAMNIVK